jgi:hypothetical protein
MTPEEIQLRRKAAAVLGVVTVLFTGFAWATAQVEGVNANTIALAVVAAGSALTALWLSFRWKVATILAVTLAILAGGAIGVLGDRSQTSDAHTIKCARPAAAETSKNVMEWQMYRLCQVTSIQHALWHMRNDTMVAVAKNMRGANETWCRGAVSHPLSYILYPLCGNRD